MKSSFELLNKYDLPAPRYTSYPTVPYWTNNPTSEEWIHSLSENLTKNNTPISVYVHIPFCEMLCTFCACNISITKNHAVEKNYVESILKEMSIYSKSVPGLKKALLQDLHLGGGTPTFLSEKQLELLLNGILKDFRIAKNAEFSIEVDPRKTRITQLDILYQLGFRRISLGVQDFNPEVQKMIHRNQSFEETKLIVDGARLLGYNSINFDLIYGLPKQSEDSVRETFQKTLTLNPDRISFYSYAHVPWIKPSQRLFTEEDLPKGNDKRRLFELGRELLEKAGYIEIGMDHFALKHDSLAKASSENKIHRNFMGYSNHKTEVMLGIGASSISETKDMYFQNEKLEVKYSQALAKGILPNLRGHKLSESDKLRKSLILEIMTKWKVAIPKEMSEDIKFFLIEMEKDNLLVWKEDLLVVTEKGKPFLRIITTAFDEKLRNAKPEGLQFSKAI